MWIFLLLVFCIYLGVFSAQAGEKIPKGREPVKLEVKVDKRSITIGEKFRYEAIASGSSELEMEFVEFGKELEAAGFAVVDFGSPEKKLFGKKTLRKWYLLDTYVTGKYTIPEITLRYKKKDEKNWHEIKSDKVEVEVKSVLTGEAKDIRDIKPPLYFPRRSFVYLILAGAVVFAATLFFVIKLLARRKISIEMMKIRPAHEVAMEQLERLRGVKPKTDVAIKDYYTQLSGIVRWYIENRFNIRAPEMTTEEFFIAVKGSKELREYRVLLGDFLIACDLVKFAKHIPEEGDIERVFETAEKFVKDTIPQDTAQVAEASK